MDEECKRRLDEAFANWNKLWVAMRCLDLAIQRIDARLNGIERRERKRCKRETLGEHDRP